MKRCLLSILSAVAFSCYAFDVTIGISGCDESLQSRLGTSTPWFSIKSSFSSDQAITTRIRTIGNPYCLVVRGSDEWSDLAMVYVPRNINNDTDAIYFGTYSSTAWNFINTEAGRWSGAYSSASPLLDSVYLGTGSTASNCVLTISGNPYSSIWNYTSEDHTINGVEIPQGAIRPVSLPLRLAYFPPTASDSSKYYFTAADGSSITYNFITINGNFRGACIGYSGDFILRENGYPNTNEVYGSSNEILYGGMNAANADKILYASNGEPLRQGFVQDYTNIVLATWWDFTQSEWGSPQAVFNGEVVCEGHSTSHIIGYSVSRQSLKIRESDGMLFTILSMSLIPSGEYSGGSCVMRCWDASVGSDESSFALCDADHKAEVSAGTGTANFLLLVDPSNGSWYFRTY